MKNMSFAMTTPQFLDGSKDVTRRFGWWNLKPGDRIRAVEKGMGLKKGEKMKVLGVIEIVCAKREPLSELLLGGSKYPVIEMMREGFPHLAPAQFVDMLCQHYNCKPETICNRIEFKRVNS